LPRFVCAKANAPGVHRTIPKTARPGAGPPLRLDMPGKNSQYFANSKPSDAFLELPAMPSETKPANQSRRPN
jgi:hypothetical protein